MSNNKRLFDKLIKRLNSIHHNKHMDAMYDTMLNGKNSYLRLTKKGSTIFDPSWITVIEDTLYDLGQIINNPREVTKNESNVVPIELAKKVDGESVQHLASHTQFIKEISESGGVIPSKILSHSNVDDIHTYENRFIATFVRRLVLFVEKRYEFIKQNVNLTTEDTLMVKHKSIVNGQEVEIETKITVKKQEDDKATVDTKDYIERIALMREYLTYYYNSHFMKEMKNEKNVRKPILQTNIIRKNPLYRKCYETFVFIEKFDSLGVSYHLDENYQSFNEDERKDINYLLLSDYLAVQDGTEFTSVKKTNKKYKPRVLTSIDDEEFTFGDIVKGPIEFVRIDDQYRQYLNSKIKKDLPTHPNKYEKEYYKEEYDYKHERKLDEKELDLLIARKEKEIALYEKIVEELIARRDIEEAEEKRRELEAIRAYQEGLIELKRRKIIEAAEAENYGPILEDEEADDFNPEDYYPDDEEDNVEPVIEKEPVAVFTVLDQDADVKFVDGHKEETYVSTEVEYVEEEAQPEEPAEEAQEEVVEETPEEVIPEEPAHEEPAQEEEQQVEEPVIEETPAEEEVQEQIEEPVNEEPQNIVVPEAPSYEDEAIIEIPEGEDAFKDAHEEPVQEEEPVQVIRKPSTGPVVYHSYGDAQVRYVDGHKEEVITVSENDDSSEEEQEVEYFIVETENGYYVSENQYSNNEYDAKIFTDLAEASEIIDRLGGTVYKL